MARSVAVTSTSSCYAADLRVSTDTAVRGCSVVNDSDQDEPGWVSTLIRRRSVMAPTTRPSTTKIAAPALLVACLAAGCGGGASSDSVASPSDPPASSSTADVSVSSSIAPGSVLARPLMWRARVNAGDAVDHVDIFVAGHLRFAYPAVPYTLHPASHVYPLDVRHDGDYHPVKAGTTSGIL